MTGVQTCALPIYNDWPLSINCLLPKPETGIELYVGGLATDYCVKATCLDGRRLGYTVYLLTDACQAANLKPGDEALAINEMLNAGVKEITTDEVLHETR